MDSYTLAAAERLTTRPARDYQHFSLFQITPVIGAEVSGLDLSRPLGEAQLAEVKDAFLTHHVLVFRDQHLTPEDHKRFAGYFGSLRRSQRVAGDDRDPEVLDIRADGNSSFVDGNGWHTDGTADAEPSLGSMLYITKPPAIGSGGDTMWANMHFAYEMLSPTMRAFLDGLTAVHDGLIPWQGHQPPAEYVIPKNEHPVVVRHPETGRKLLFVNPGFTSHIVQLSPDESRSLLDLLFTMVATRPVLSCRVRWTPNTLVFWDNRCTQHHAIWDYYPHERYGQRVTVNGTRPTA